MGDTLTGSGPMSEDCLRLNVWTPGVQPGARRPVLVYLHGGGFRTGSGGALMYDGKALARKHDVVVVTVNHRLNVFGFLYLPEIGGESTRGHQRRIVRHRAGARVGPGQHRTIRRRSPERHGLRPVGRRRQDQHAPGVSSRERSLSSRDRAEHTQRHGRPWARASGRHEGDRRPFSPVSACGRPTSTRSRRCPSNVSCRRSSADRDQPAKRREMRAQPRRRRRLSPAICRCGLLRSWTAGRCRVIPSIQRPRRCRPTCRSCAVRSKQNRCRIRRGRTVLVDKRHRRAGTDRPREAIARAFPIDRRPR